MENRFRKLQISLCHMHLIVDDHRKIIESLGNEAKVSEALMSPISKYLLIRTTAFYDELDKHYLKIADKLENRYKTLVTIRKILIGKRDQYFPDLTNIRNHALAHHYRIKKESWRSIFEQETEYTIPKSPAELSVNSFIMDQILSSVKILYPEVNKVILHDLKAPIEHRTTITDKNYKSIMTEMQCQIQSIIDQNL